MTYSDDTEGWMRVHIGQRRGQLACDRYTKRSLADHARAHKVWGVRWRKLDLATTLAFRGLIDSDGNLRDGWPR